MRPRRLIAVLRRRAPLIVGAVIIGLLVGYLSSARHTTYRAQAILYVGRPITSATTAKDAYAPELLAALLAPAAASTQVAQAALTDGHLHGSAAAVAAATTGAVLPGTSLVVVSVADPDPLRSELLTNAVAAAFARVAATLPPTEVVGVAPTTTTTTPGSAKGGASPGGGRASSGAPGQPEPVAVYHTALLPTSPLPTATGHDTELGGLIGLVVALAAIGLLDLTGLRARSAVQLEAELDLPVLGVLPHCRTVTGPAAEATDAAPEPAGPGGDEV